MRVEVPSVECAREWIGPRLLEDVLVVPFPPELQVNARHQREAVDRLGHKIVGAGLKPPDEVIHIGEGCHHDDRDVRRRRIGLDATADLKTVELRHHHVQQDDVGLFGRDLCQRLKAVEGGAHDVMLGREHDDQQLDVHLVIIDDKNAGQHTRGSLVRG